MTIKENQTTIEWKQGVLPEIAKGSDGSDFVMVARKMGDSYLTEFGTLEAAGDGTMYWELDTGSETTNYPVEDVIAWAELPQLPEHIRKQLEDIATDKTADTERKQREKEENDELWARLYDEMHETAVDTGTKAQKARYMIAEALKMVQKEKAENDD